MRIEFFIIIMVLLFSLIMRPLFYNSAGCLIQSVERKDDSIYSDILKVDLRSYIGKPIYFLLDNKVISKYKQFTGFSEPPGVLQYFNFELSPKISINVYSDGYLFVKRFSTDENWKLNDFKKEKLRKIEILYGFKIVKTIK